MNYKETRSKSAFPNNKKAEYQDNSILINKNNISNNKPTEEINSYLKLSQKLNQKAKAENSYIGMVKEKNENIKGKILFYFSF